MLKGKRILIVDDSRAICQFLSRVLTREGAQTETATTGSEALALWRAKRFDLILLDLLLPDTDGIEVLRRIRAEDDEVVVVMVTGTGGIKAAIASVREGADNYIEKHDLSIGGDLTEFFHALEQAIEHRMGVLARKELERLKMDFYAMITHDLRSPAASIQSALELLLDESTGPLNSVQAELVKLAHQASHHLLELINDFLDYSQIEAGYLRLDIGPVDIAEIVSEAVAYAEVLAQPRRQTISVDIPSDLPKAQGDAQRLRQVLDNLLSNAIKYTPEGGRITVTVRLTQDAFAISVQDTGIGIPPEELPNLFSKYHRARDARSRGIKGTGLGLLIVKEIVEAHGGRIEVQSEPGRGSTFTVFLPRSDKGSAQK